MVINFYVKQSIFITSPNIFYKWNGMMFACTMKCGAEQVILIFAAYKFEENLVCEVLRSKNSIFEVDRLVINVSRILIQLNELFSLP